MLSKIKNSPDLLDMMSVDFALVVRADRGVRSGDLTSKQLKWPRSKTRYLEAQHIIMLSGQRVANGAGMATGLISRHDQPRRHVTGERKKK